MKPEQEFLDCSHGYQRGKGPQRAALELSQRLQRGWYGVIFDADIKGFFDNIDHDWLLRMLEQRLSDQTFLGLIRKWGKAGILEKENQVILPVTGTPQGGVVSAVLAMAGGKVVSRKRNIMVSFDKHLFGDQFSLLK